LIFNSSKTLRAELHFLGKERLSTEKMKPSLKRKKLITDSTGRAPIREVILFLLLSWTSLCIAGSHGQTEAAKGQKYFSPQAITAITSNKLVPTFHPTKFALPTRLLIVAWRKKLRQERINIGIMGMLKERYNRTLEAWKKSPTEANTQQLANAKTELKVASENVLTARYIRTCAQNIAHQRIRSEIEKAIRPMAVQL